MKITYMYYSHNQTLIECIVQYNFQDIHFITDHKIPSERLLSLVDNTYNEKVDFIENLKDKKDCILKLTNTEGYKLFSQNKN